MWVAVVLTFVGLLCVALITQYTGYRLGGVITVPVMAIYSLREFLMIPVFFISVVVAYLGLWLIKKYTLVYGRNLLVATIVIGSIVPTTVFLLLVGFGANLGVIQFIGSILPGLAAYNYQEIDPEHRKNDLLVGTVVFVALFCGGWLLVNPVVGERLGRLTPPILFAPTSDVAVFRGAAGYQGTTGIVEAEPVIISRLPTVFIFAGGLAASELARRRYGVRIGVVAAVLMAIYALASYWLIVMYVVMLVLMFAFAEGLGYLTLRYGRVLLGITISFSMVVGVLLIFVLPVVRGPSAYFVAILSAVTAYNAHTSAPLERRLVLPLQLAIFAPTLVAARYITEPLPGGIPQQLTMPVVTVAAFVTVLCLAVAEVYTVRQPDEDEVLSESVLSGGGTG